MSLLSVQKLVKRFGGVLATDHLDLEVQAGELHALIGPNGAGKTTLINQLSGELPSTHGKIVFQGRDVTQVPVHERALMGIARSYQVTSVFAEFTAMQNVMLAVQARSGHSFSFWRPALDERALREPALEMLQTVGLGTLADEHVCNLAYGECRQLEIAMTLAMQPKVLLLDEPMAGMSQRESHAIVELLLRLKGRYGIVLVEHDMDAVFALADRITVLVYGRGIATGTANEIRSSPEVKVAYLGDEETGP
jgi:branched-chain amino acid transport system ATP-binding protein